MVALWLAIPLIARYALLGAAGLLGGALANHIIYSWAYFPRPISPWAEKSPEAPDRSWKDRIPLVGWLRLRREREIHGRWFWIRPILIELALAAALPYLYWYETQAEALLPLGFRGAGFFASWGATMYLSHAILLVLMVAATFIDFDEQTIPDLITIPGTILALVMSCFSLSWFMPAGIANPVVETTFSIPWPLNPKWTGTAGLWTGLGIWSGWCFALADRRLILRKGLAKAVEFFFAGLVRHGTWKLLLAIWIIGMFGIGLAHGIGGQTWQGLFTSLIGLAVGGGVVWAIRLVASSAMGVEAMGFGDVTLMAMIGAFVGWQAALLAFFLSPFAAIVIVLIQYIITREPRVPFGPYLCAGTALAILYWDRLFNQWFVNVIVTMGAIGIWMGIVIFGMMWFMLFVWRIIKEAILNR